MTGGKGAAGFTLTLIVPCYSMERYDDLLRLVASIGSQSEAIDQVVFVVQESTELRDRLRDALHTRTLRGSTEIVFVAGRPGVACARNSGVDHATGDIVAFTDDDAILTADWAEQTRRAFRAHPRMVGLAGAVLPMWDSPAMTWFPRELYWMLSCTYWNSASAVRVRNGYGVNMSFLRSAFDGGRRFKESLGIGAWSTGAWRGIGGEEPDLCLRVSRETGGEILYIPDVQVWHRVRPYRLRAGTVVRRAYWEGRYKALLRQDATGGSVFETEYDLLRTMLHNSMRRLLTLPSHPCRAVRRQAVVTVAVSSVFCGYIEGRLRRLLRTAFPRAGVLADKTDRAEDK